METQQIPSGKGKIKFPERIVKAVNVNRSQLELLSTHSDHIAEYRRAKESAAFWEGMENREQAQWADDLLGRLSTDQQSEVSVCILDNGINNGHPLLSPMLAAGDCLSLEEEWGTHDHHPGGHGTLMAGVVAYGDLAEILASSHPVSVNHHLESVKILPPTGSNPKELWGDLTARGISLAEYNQPTWKRIPCMAVTASDNRDRGRPSSWSGALDGLAAGTDDDETRRLIIVSAGNVFIADTLPYPEAQCSDAIHDPAQAWNVLTVGAYTEHTTIQDPSYSNYRPIAPEGGLSPFSTTSLEWEKKWPVKPDIVMEGGNAAVDGNFSTECADLSPLSTSHMPHQRLFDFFNMTSAATAQAAWLAAQIQYKYPDFWPETIRGLMVHSARWTNAMRDQFLHAETSRGYEQLIRTCGYGVPRLDLALESASNALTMITQNQIQPFYKRGSDYKTKEMHLYDLPWPTEVLQNLPSDTPVSMRITLSYFIEPGPGEIGWTDRYRYPSHLLRFDVKSPAESKEEFSRRINKAARDEDEGHPGTQSASNHWVIGPRNRNKGSIHSDIWQGSAAELADSNIIAVYPAIGWWRSRQHLV